jgi:hypothetical protein
MILDQLPAFILLAKESVMAESVLLAISALLGVFAALILTGSIFRASVPRSTIHSDAQAVSRTAHDSGTGKL